MTTFQPSLLQLAEPVAFDGTFGGLTRQWLDPSSWVDLLPGWVSGSDHLFHDVLAARQWGVHTRLMYGTSVVEPRRTDLWREGDGPLTPPILERMRKALGDLYDVHFDSVGFNHYRDGADSVAWHRDRISLSVPHPVVAIVSLGEPRVLSLRRVGGASELAFQLGRGDLFVTGGLAQVGWEHAVLKTARPVGQRISVAFRRGLRPAPSS